MGADLFDSVEIFVEHEGTVDSMLGYSLRDLCLHDRDDRLRLTQFTQPCLYVVNALAGFRAIESGARPDFFAGHSLGEYNALLLAGAFDFLTGLALVKKRGELMAKVSGGKMLAVIGLTASVLEDIVRHEFSNIDIANYNAPTQTVLSGPPDDIGRIQSSLKSAGAQMCVELPVSAAFHSRYMQSIADAYGEFLGSFTFHPLKTPVVANVTGNLYPDNCSQSDIKQSLVKQLYQSVHWVKSIRFLIDRGVDQFEELGPGKVLTNLIRQIKLG